MTYAELASALALDDWLSSLGSRPSLSGAHFTPSSALSETAACLQQKWTRSKKLVRQSPTLGMCRRRGPPPLVSRTLFRASVAWGLKSLACCSVYVMCKKHHKLPHKPGGACR